MNQVLPYLSTHRRASVLLALAPVLALVLRPVLCALVYAWGLS